MKELILSDIHQKYKVADRIIKKEKPDKIITTGDWFDDFGDSPYDTEEMCKWALDNLSDHNTLGNHDQHYFFNNPNYICTGYEYAKHEVILKYFNKELVQTKFQLYQNCHGFLLSHAGLTRDLIPNWKSEFVNLPFICNTLDRVWERMYEEPDFKHIFLGIGKDRGGLDDHGGITWCDWKKFIPIPGISQIVGHTPGLSARYKSDRNNESGTLLEEMIVTPSMGISICLDTHLKHYAIIDDGILTVKRA